MQRGHWSRVKNRVVGSDPVLGRAVSEEPPEEVALSRDPSEAKIKPRRDVRDECSGRGSSMGRGPGGCREPEGRWGRVAGVRQRVCGGGWVGREPVRALGQHKECVSPSEMGRPWRVEAGP